MSAIKAIWLRQEIPGKGWVLGLETASGIDQRCFLFGSLVPTNNSFRSLVETLANLSSLPEEGYYLDVTPRWISRDNTMWATRCCMPIYLCHYSHDAPGTTESCSFVLRWSHRGLKETPSRKEGGHT